MKWSIQELRKRSEKKLHFDEKLDLTSDLLSRDRDLLDVSPIRVCGDLFIEDAAYILNAQVSCEVTLPSTRSLTPVCLPLQFTLDEVYMTETQYAQRPEEWKDEIVFVLEKDLIDLTEAIEDNLLLNLPLQVLSEEEQAGAVLPSGQGWEVVLESEYEASKAQAQRETVDPRLAKLATFFDEEEPEA